LLKNVLLQMPGRLDSTSDLLNPILGGETMPEAAAVLGISVRTAERNWTYAKSWLRRELTDTHPASGGTDLG
jgi:hypothetical protein